MTNQEKQQVTVHKWHKELVALANLQEVQYRFKGGVWGRLANSYVDFNSKDYEFRVRPETDYHYQWLVYEKLEKRFLLSRHVESVTQLKEFNDKTRYMITERLEKSKLEVIL